MIESMQNNENSNLRDNENVLLLNRQRFFKSTMNIEVPKNSTRFINPEQKK